MAKAGITIKLEGFEGLLNDIEAAGRSMESAVESCLKENAQTVDKELRTQLKNVSESDLAAKMPAPIIEREGNQVSAFVGFHKGAYNPKNPSDGYKALFLNYGTPYRKKHGQESARGFITKAKQNSVKVIRRQQKQTLTKILARLKK